MPSQESLTLDFLRNLAVSEFDGAYTLSGDLDFTGLAEAGGLPNADAASMVENFSGQLTMMFDRDSLYVQSLEIRMNGAVAGTGDFVLLVGFNLKDFNDASIEVTPPSECSISSM